MKILSFDPLSLASRTDLDQSKLAYHSRSITLADLPNLKPGIVLIGIADDTGVKNVGGRPGAKDGPLATRQKLYKFTLGAPAVPFYDLGDVLPLSSIEDTHAAGEHCVAKALESGHFPLVIGGGHDLAFPHALAFLRAAGRAPTAYWNIDAHLDVRPVTSGITSGSPWYLLREHKNFRARQDSIHEFGLQKHCNGESLVKYAEERGFRLHWLEKIRATSGSADAQFSRLLKKVSRQTRSLVSLDIDSVQWSDAPGCSAPQTVGFTAAEAIAMSLAAGREPTVKSFGVFELSPAHDPDGRTANLVAHCISACFRGFQDRRIRAKK